MAAAITDKPAAASHAIRLLIDLPRRWVAARLDSAVRRMILVYEIERALLGLDVKTAEILADDAERDELNTAEQQHDDHQRGIAAHRIAEDERLGQHPDAEHEGKRGGGKANIGRELQRRARERRDSIDREVPEPPVIPFRLAGVARIAVIHD